MQGPHAIVEETAETLKKFKGGLALEDDVTLVIVRFAFEQQF